MEKRSNNNKADVYRDDFNALLKNIILASTINEEELLKIILLHHRMIKPLVPWSAVYASLTSPDGSILSRKTGKGAIVPERLAEEKSHIFLTTVRDSSTKRQRKLVCFSVYDKDEKIYSDAIVLAVKAEIPSKKELDLIYGNMKLLIGKPTRFSRIKQHWFSKTCSINLVLY